MISHKYWDNENASLSIRFDSSILHEIREANRKKVRGIVDFSKKVGANRSVQRTVQIIRESDNLEIPDDESNLKISRMVKREHSAQTLLPKT